MVAKAQLFVFIYWLITHKLMVVGSERFGVKFVEFVAI